VRQVLQQQISEPQEEFRLRTTIPSLTAITDEISRKVHAQYEEMPYPRWVKAAPVGRPVALAWYLRNQFPTAPIKAPAQTDRLDLLIAGCGTGQHTLETARRFAGAAVLAIDLSRTSLAYAKRKTQELGIGNIEFAQADILELGSLARRFDLVEASGVLHHLKDPQHGWRILLSLLRPKGFMHVALYSACARESVRKTRSFIADRGYRPEPVSMRQFRQEILSLADENPLKEVASYSDFYSMSECRDLLFHANERHFTLSEIKSFLAENNLQFIGFDGDVVHEFRMRYPSPEPLLELDRWHEFETANPKSFVNMYQFWLQKSE
jgi:SAM-dependent methyltransferase